MPFSRLEKVFAFATTSEYEREVVLARAEHESITGEIHEDEPIYELWMQLFLEWYVLDRQVRTLVGGMTPLDRFLHDHRELDAAERDAYGKLAHARQGLFEVRAVAPKKALLEVRDMFSGEDTMVTERRGLPGIERGDVITARLFPLDGSWVMSRSILLHPREARPMIVKAVRKIRQDGEPTPMELMRNLAVMRVKFERLTGPMRFEKVYRQEALLAPPPALGLVEGRPISAANIRRTR